MRHLNLAFLILLTWSCGVSEVGNPKNRDWTDATKIGAAKIDTVSTNSFNGSPKVGIDGSGNAIAAWLQVVEGDFVLTSSQFVKEEGWKPTKTITDNLVGVAPALSVNQGGNALVTWVRNHNNTTWDSYAAQFVQSEGWQEEELIETLPQANTWPNIVLDNLGHGFAVGFVHEYTGDTRFDYWANEFSSASGWGTARLIESDNSGSTIGGPIVIDHQGNAFTAYTLEVSGLSEPPYTSRTAWVVEYSTGSGWGTPQRIDDGMEGVSALDMVSNKNGDLLAVWGDWDNHEPGSNRQSIWANWYRKGAGWGEPELLEEITDSSSYHPKPCLNDKGEALVTWTVVASLNTMNIYGTEYLGAGKWGSPQMLQDSETGNGSQQKCVLSEEGNALVVWEQQNEDIWSIWATEFSTENGWKEAVLLEKNDVSDARHPQISMNDDGDAIVVWEQQTTEEPTSDIWSVRYE